MASEGDWETAASLLIPEEEWPTITGHAAGREILTTIFYTLLAMGDLEAAASLTWSRTQFSLRPASARRIWELYDEEMLLLIQGGGSVGKSYTLSARGILDFARDPEYTLFRVVSVTAGHAKLNIFAQMQELHKRSLIQLPGTVTSDKITCDPASDISGIHLVAIPQGDSGKGRIRGIHPKPRPKPHPVFGNLTRTRIMLDECEEIPSGVWEELGNAILTVEAGDNDRIKIMGASNPKDQASEFGKRCEPQGGFKYDSEDTEWYSVRGWKVYRIDGQNTENVVEKRVVEGCEGLVTYDGFHKLIQNSGGEGTAEYWTMCRGQFPPYGHSTAIIPRMQLDKFRGDWIFEGPTTEVISCDSSLSGGDATVLTYTQFGMAKSFRGLDGKTVEVHKSPRLVLQFDHQVSVPVQPDSMAIARGIQREIGPDVDPNWFAIDATGTADGCASALADGMGDILQIVYSQAASTTTLMDEDARVAIDMFVNCRAEMYYCFKAWLDAGLICISSACKEDMLKELSGVRGEQTGKKYKVERKDAYKKRNKGKSPDHADSAIQSVHIVRIRGDIIQGYLAGHKKATTLEDMVFKNEVSEFDVFTPVDVTRD